jgi:hypothetical protein
LGVSGSALCAALSRNSTLVGLLNACLRACSQGKTPGIYRHYFIEGKTRYLSRSAAQHYALGLGVSGSALCAALSRNSTLTLKACSQGKTPGIYRLYHTKGKTRFLSRLENIQGYNDAIAVCETHWWAFQGRDSFIYWQYQFKYL